MRNADEGRKSNGIFPPSRAHKIHVIKASLPKGGGDLKGLGETFSPHEFSGSSGLSIPFPVTPCRGFEPHISMSYSSGNGNGPCGLGWELSLPDISRQTSKRIPKYDGTDTFLYSGDDYLVPELDARGKPVTKSSTLHHIAYNVEWFRPRTAGVFDIIARYTRADDPADVFWLITHADNSTSIFGKSAAARIFDPQNPRRIFKWLLEETYDAKGNHQVLEYSKEDGRNIKNAEWTADRGNHAQSYLSKIRYGNDQPITDGSLILGQSKSTIRTTTWHFEIVLDYGQYDPDAKNPSPYRVPKGSEWTCRLDPFSDYRAGFEIRTYRLCRNVLLFHHFPEEFQTPEPVLTHRLQLGYEESPPLSLLAQVESSGYRFSKGAKVPYEVQSLPPLELGYSPFAPASPGYTPHDYEAFDGEDGAGLVGLSRAPDYHLVDLYGGGAPGVLYADGETVRYRAPRSVAEGDIEYAPSEDISFPISRRSQDATHTLIDLSGNGKLDLLVSVPEQTGFYEVNADQTWNNWQPLDSVPTELLNPDVQQVDVTGDGLADLLLIEDDQVRVYPSAGVQGYGPALTIEPRDDLPVSGSGGRQSLVTFAEMCGLGQAQLVRLTGNRVECWPSLGYGRFGAKITLARAPDFGPDFDVARVRLTDVDGSGMSDIAYIHSDCVEIYLNQSGNGFAQTPMTIPLPEGWDALDQIQFADVRGNGAECLVFTTAHPEPRQWFYDFNRCASMRPDGACELISQKPYLLTQTQNNMGALTRIRYASSSKFYLEDQRNGFDWITRLPFPVQVIESVMHVDQIAKSTAISSYRYHHGYYDGVEREFRGFGRVDRTDATSFADFNPETRADKAAYHAPPMLTRTWYHTGAYLAADDLLSAFKKEYWQGDAKAPQLPGTTFLFADASTLLGELIQDKILSPGGLLRKSLSSARELLLDVIFEPYRARLFAFMKKKKVGAKVTAQDLATLLKIPLHSDADALRGAHRTLHGSVLRSEVYGRDRTPWQETPYAVSESQFIVRQLQHKESNEYAVFLLHEREHIHSDYERNPDDPRIRHSFVLAMDAYGHVLKSARVHYGRRSRQIPPGLDARTKAQQTALRIVCAEQILINSPQLGSVDFYVLGLPQGSKSFEVTGLTPQGRYFTFSELRDGLGGVGLGGATKTLLHWERDYYYDAAKQQELPYGQVTGQALHHRTEHIEFDKQKLSTQFHGVKAAAELPALLKNEGGYLEMQASDADSPDALGYYWNPGSSQTYRAGCFYLPEAFFDPFSYKTKAQKTTYAYDHYSLLVTRVTDPLQNTARVTKIDYQHLAPTRLQDSNGNTSEVLFDPLGMVIATSFHGTENGLAVGFEPLEHYTPRRASTLEAVMETPQKYLQKAASYFYYDLFSWLRHTITQADLKVLEGVETKALWQSLMAANYITAKGATTATFCALPSWHALEISSPVLTDRQKQRLFRLLQGTPVHFAALGAEQYPGEETVTNTIQKAVTYADGFGRHVQSKTFLDSKEAVRSWDAARQKVVTKKGVDPCYLTSGAVRYDDKGQPIQQYEPYFAPDYRYVDEQVLNEVGYSDTLFYDSLGRRVLSVSAEGFLTKTLQGSWGTEKTGTFSGYLNTALYASLPRQLVPSPWHSLHFDANDTVKDSTCYRAYRKTGTSPSADVDGAGLEAAEKCFNTPVIVHTDSLGRTVQSEQHDVEHDNERNATFSELDLLGNVLTSTDQRLSGIGKHNFVTSYNLSKEPVKTISADGGTRWELRNAVGKVFWSFDSRGTTTTSSFDPLHRPVSVHVRHRGEADPTLDLDQTVQYLVYGDSLDGKGKPLFSAPEDRNLRGKAVIGFDQSGLDLSPFYTLRGQPQASGKILTTDYTAEPEWDSTAAELPNLVKALAKIQDPEALSRLQVTDLKIAALEKKIYTTSSTYDALGRVTTSTDPDGNTIASQYYANGWLRSTATTPGAVARKAAKKSQPPAPAITRITYNAKGQHTKVTAGNGVATAYTYDEKNFRLLGIVSTKAGKSGGRRLQDLAYHHDPVGNVISVTDRSIPTVFFRGEKVKPQSTYSYDTLYRLIKATGREHVAMWRNLQHDQNKIKDLAHLPTRAQPVANGQALQSYTETYTYDTGGNLTAMQHHAKNAKVNRSMQVAVDSNRLSSSSLGQRVTTYTYDSHGNQTTLGGTQALHWSYRNNVSSAVIVQQPRMWDIEYYVYDGRGNRVRKVREAWMDVQEAGMEKREAGMEAVMPRKAEVIYLGAFEIRRSRIQKEEWHWVNAAGCRWGYLAQGTKPSAKAYQLRYQLSNHLNSSTMELDANGRVITYEEYYPYGGTAIIAAGNRSEVGQRYYRYSGKEADNATGLYYYGMRYYCPWLGRWTAPDPAGTVDGLNIFAFVGGNPVTMADIGGMGRRTATPVRHGLPIKDIPGNEELKERAEKLGQKLGKRIHEMRRERAHFLAIWQETIYDKIGAMKRLGASLEGVQRRSGMTAQDDATVAEAIKSRLAGDKEEFSKLYHRAHGEMDELVSTNLVVGALLSGIRPHLGDEAGRDLVQATFQMISRLRLPTSEVGYAYSGANPDRAQHPTARGTELWAASGEQHDRWNRMRAEDVIKVGEAMEGKSSDPTETLKAMAAEAGRHSLAWSVAPATAANMTLMPSITRAQMNAQVRHRDAVKEMSQMISGTWLRGWLWTTTQASNSEWNAQRSRGHSPLRV